MRGRAVCLWGQWRGPGAGREGDDRFPYCSQTAPGPALLVGTKQPCAVERPHSKNPVPARDSGSTATRRNGSSAT